MKEHYCKSPFMSLFVYDDGRVKSCCAGGWDWGNLKEKTLQEIVNDPKVIELRKDIVEGKHNSYCDYCKGCEENAGESQRVYFTKFQMSQEDLYNPETFKLMMVDMRWNNLCNLNCAYCAPLWSTTWQKAMGMPMTDLKTNHFVSVLDEVKSRSQYMEAIIMGGGEPLLHQQNIELLQSLDDNILIDIMTNLSTNIDHSPVFAELKKKNNVNWCVSFENLGDEFEFVRHGARWDRLVKNLNVVKNLEGHTRTFKPTYNILSATRLVKLYELANEYDFQIHWQTLLHPEQLSVARFSKPVIAECIKEIDNLFSSNAFIQYNSSTRFKQGTSFFTYLREELQALLDIEYTTIDKKFREWLFLYESKYAADVKKFHTLWPELDQLIER